MATFRIINKETHQVWVKNSPPWTAVWFLGRRVSDYFIIKSDEQGDRLFVSTTPDFCRADVLQNELDLF